MIRRYIVLSAALIFAGAAQAQAPTAAQLAERLNVSEGTATVVAEVLGDMDQQPGALWGAAATLHRQLSDEQRAELLSSAKPNRDRGARQQALTRRGDDASRYVDRLVTELDLSEVQQRQLRAVHERHASEIRSLLRQFRAGEVDRQQLEQQGRQIVREVQPILTPAQQERAIAMLQEMQRGADRGQVRERRARLGGERQALQRSTEQRREAYAQRQAARDAALNLTAEQRQQLEQVGEQSREARERRGRDNQRQRGAVQLDRTQMRGSLAQVLTTEQREIVQLHAVLARAAMTRARR